MVKLARVEHALVSGFAFRFFEFRGRGREWARNERLLLEHARASGQRSLL